MPTPKAPGTIDPLAREILEGLRDHPEAAAMVLGGGFALKHYLDARPTHDIDAWWAPNSTMAEQQQALSGLRAVVTAVADSHDLTVKQRSWGDVYSLDLIQPTTGKATFSFQIADRDRYLEAPRSSPWPPLPIESFHDTIASKMSALVNRGAPRDILDIYALCRARLTTETAVWRLWRRKNPHLDETAAHDQIRHHAAALEARRPLDSLLPEQRAAVGAVRAWLTNQLIDPTRNHTGDR
ncbi:MAG: nucleotidyl transferase AbiEii/AbiGii toxin family protein [Chloroflexota bacterium]